VAVIDADASHLPFRDSSFDMVVSFAAFPHFIHKDRAVQETGGCSAGRVVFIIHLGSSKEVADVHKRLGGLIENDTLPATKDLRRMFTTAGLITWKSKIIPGCSASAVNAK